MYGPEQPWFEKTWIPGDAERANEVSRNRLSNDRYRKVKSLLESSEKYLIESGDPTQLAKTRVELARLKLKQGYNEKARVLARKAWKGFSGRAGFFYPEDLRHLLEVKGGLPLPRDTRVEILGMKRTTLNKRLRKLGLR